MHYQTGGLYKVLLKVMNEVCGFIWMVMDGDVSRSRVKFHLG